jgi:hypothetical protein
MAGDSGLGTADLLELLGGAIVATGTIVATVLTGASKLRREFSKLQKWQRTHDRKDDRRFAIIDQHIYGMTLRNSIKDGTEAPRHRPINDLVAEEINHDGDEEGDD